MQSALRISWQGLDNDLGLDLTWPIYSIFSTNLFFQGFNLYFIRVCFDDNQYFSVTSPVHMCAKPSQQKTPSFHFVLANLSCLFSH